MADIEAAALNFNTTTVSDIRSALLAALKLEHATQLEQLARAVRHLCTACSALQQIANRNMPLRPTSCPVPSINGLLSIVSATQMNRVTVEPCRTYQDLFKSVKKLLAQVGLSASPETWSILSVPSKALLLYTSALARWQERQAVCAVSRSSPLPSVMRATERYWLRDAANGESQCCPVKLFPQFARLGEWAWGGEAEDGGVEGGEGHGPRKELFLLLGAALCGRPSADAHKVQGRDADRGTPPQGSVRQLSPADSAVFVWSQGSGKYWFNGRLSDSDSNRNKCTFAGWLLGQCIMNRAVLGVQLATPILQHVLVPDGKGLTYDLETLKAYDPAQAASLQRVVDLPEAEYKRFLQFEGLPTGMPREHCMAMMVERALYSDVEWMVQCLRAGFERVIEVERLTQFKINCFELRAMVCGPPPEMSNYAIQDVFHVVMDKALRTPASEGGSAPLGEALWKVIDSWPPNSKRKLVEFVTASTFLPIPKTELIRVELPFVTMTDAEATAQLGMLPQAHTCENLLELPDYWHALLSKHRVSYTELDDDQVHSLQVELGSVLHDRLHYAIFNCAGFDLDDSRHL